MAPHTPNAPALERRPVGELQRRGRYLVVGAAGFAVDAGLLSLLVHLFGLDPILARAPSFLAAVTVTWILNRTHTFAGRSRFDRKTEYRRYFSVQIAGALANLAIYVLLIRLFPPLGQLPIIPLAAGAVGGLIVNYKLSSTYVFPEQSIDHGK